MKPTRIVAVFALCAACVVSGGGQPAGPEKTTAAPTASDAGVSRSVVAAKLDASMTPPATTKRAATPPLRAASSTSTQPADAGVRRDAAVRAVDAARLDAGHETPQRIDAGSGTAAFASPCPSPGFPCRVMPLGDSNTAGWLSTDEAGYRTQLFRRTCQAHQAISFVGQQSSGPATVDGVEFPRANEGYLGATISDGGGRSGVQQLAVPHIQTEKPDIVLLMIGTNDVDIKLDLPNAPARLGALIDSIFGSFSGLLVVAQIPPTTNDEANVRVSAYNAALPAVIQARVRAGKHILLVDVYSAITSDPNFKDKLMADGLHPNDAGYAVVGNVWYEALAPYLR